jgi:hypothetical protein
MVAGWADYVTQLQVAEPGSSLAKDDALFAVLPPSHLAWQGILSAVDHLDSFFGLLDGGKSHPLAPGTLARAGVLGAAHALWLLDAPTVWKDRNVDCASRTRSSNVTARR